MEVQLIDMLTDGAVPFEPLKLMHELLSLHLLEYHRRLKTSPTLGFVTPGHIIDAFGFTEMKYEKSGNLAK